MIKLSSVKYHITLILYKPTENFDKKMLINE